MKKIIYKFCIYLQIFLLLFQGSWLLAINPLDPDIEKYTISLRGSSWNRDDRVHTKALSPDVNFSHFILDASLWELPEGEGFGLSQNEHYILSAFRKDGRLHVQTEEKKLFLHPGEDKKLSFGSLFFETKGSLVLVRGDLSGESHISANKIYLGVNPENSISFMESFTCRATRALKNYTHVKGKEGKLLFQSEEFSNEGKIEVKSGFLGFKVGVNAKKAFIRAEEDFFVSGESEGRRFSTFENKGDIIAWWLVNFDGSSFSQTETGRILVAGTFQGDFDVYRDAGKTRSLEKIRIYTNDDMDLLGGGLVHSKMVFLLSGKRLRIKERGHIKGHHSVTLNAEGNFVFEKGAKIDLFSDQEFPYELFYKGKTKSPTEEMIRKKISRYVKSNSARLGLGGNFSSGIRINVHGALMDGGVSFGNGSFMLKAQEGTVDSIIKGGSFEHNVAIMTVDKLDFRGSIKMAHVVFESMFAHLRGLIEAAKVAFEGGVIRLDRDLKTHSLENAAHISVERNRVFEAEDIKLRGGSFHVQESAIVKAQTVRGSGGTLQIEGIFDARSLDLSLHSLNIKPKGRFIKERGSLFTKEISVETDHFNVEKELSIMAERSHITADSLNVLGSFSAMDADLDLQRWQNAQGSRVNIGSLRGHISRTEFQGEEANFQNMWVRGGCMTVGQYSNLNVYRTADVRLSGDFLLEGNGYFRVLDLNAKRFLANRLHTPFAHVSAKETRARSWRGDQIQLDADQINIFENFNARIAAFRGQSLRFFPGSKVVISEDGQFKFSDSVGFEGTMQIGHLRLQAPAFNVIGSLQSTCAEMDVDNLTVQNWTGTSLQGRLGHTNIFGQANFEGVNIRGQDFKVHRGGQVVISGRGEFNLSNALTVDGTMKIWDARLRSNTVGILGSLQTTYADVMANDVTLTGDWTGNSLQGRLDHTNVFGMFHFQGVNIRGQDFRVHRGGQSVISGRGEFNLSNTLDVDGTLQILGARLRAQRLNVPGILQTTYADVDLNDVSLRGDWTGNSLQGRLDRTHHLGRFHFNDVDILGQDFISSRGSQVHISGSGLFNLSNSFHMSGRAQIGNTWVNTHTIDIPGSLQTGYGNLNAQRARITGILRGDNLDGNIVSLYNSGTFRAHHGFGFRGDDFYNSGFLGGNQSTCFDYSTYRSFGNLSTQNLWMRIDDRNLSSHDLWEIGSRSRLGHLEILTHKDAFFRQSLYLKHSLTLTAPSISFAADPRVFRLFGREFSLPGHASFSSNQDLVFRTTKGGFFAKDFDIEGRRTFVESVEDLNFYGSILKGREYLGIQGRRNLTLVRTWRPSQLIGGTGEIQTVFAPRLNRNGCPILDGRGGYIMDFFQEKVGLNIHVNGELYNDASHIFARGSALISADQKITATPRVINHYESHTKRSFWGKKKTTTCYWQEVLRPMMASTEGRVLLYSSQGGMDLRAPDIVGAHGATLMGRGQMSLFDVVTRSSIKTSKSFGWGLIRSSSESKIENSEPAWVIAPKGNITVISQDQGIWSRGAYFMTPYHSSFTAKKDVLFTVSPLSVEHTKTREGFFVKPRILHIVDVLSSDSFKEGFSKLMPLTQRLAAFGEAEGTFNQIASAVSVGISGWNASKSFEEMGSFWGGIGNQVGLLNSEGNLNTTVEIGYKKSSSKFRFIRKGEGGIFCSSLAVVSHEGNITLDNGIPVIAPESILLRAPNGDVVQKGFESSSKSSHKTESFSVEIDPFSETIITGVNGHSSGSRTSGITQSPQVLESANVNIQAKGLIQDVARIIADYFEVEVQRFESKTRQDSLEHEHWSASFSVRRSSLPGLSVAYGTREELLTSERSGVSVKRGIVRVGIMSATGSILEFGDASVFAKEIHTASLQDFISGEEKGLGFTPGKACHSINVVFGEREYEALQNSNISGSHILVNGRPFVYLPPVTEVQVDRTIDLAFEIPIPVKGVEQTKPKEKTKEPTTFLERESMDSKKDSSYVSSVGKKEEIKKETRDPVKEKKEKHPHAVPSSGEPLIQAKTEGENVDFQSYLNPFWEKADGTLYGKFHRGIEEGMEGGVTYVKGITHTEQLYSEFVEYREKTDAPLNWVQRQLLNHVVHNFSPTDQLLAKGFYYVGGVSQPLVKKVDNYVMGLANREQLYSEFVEYSDKTGATLNWCQRQLLNYVAHNFSPTNQLLAKGLPYIAGFSHSLDRAEEAYQRFWGMSHIASFVLGERDMSFLPDPVDLRILRYQVNDLMNVALIRDLAVVPVTHMTRSFARSFQPRLQKGIDLTGLPGFKSEYVESFLKGKGDIIRSKKTTRVGRTGGQAEGKYFSHICFDDPLSCINKQALNLPLFRNDVTTSFFFEIPAGTPFVKGIAASRREIQFVEWQGHGLFAVPLQGGAPQIFNLGLAVQRDRGPMGQFLDWFARIDRNEFVPLSPSTPTNWNIKSLGYIEVPSNIPMLENPFYQLSDPEFQSWFQFFKKQLPLKP
ncbi:MAG: hypothetical protein B7Y25_05805 [Alphaproteobacteria bacterium 16-39-46]|nr:MAG: hypothetical protein B7Y25_05805 [Alphaproteobacteria bacterium 16-39-46]OZA42541.1 MAG: hypothetical protein B7X84_05710 [Alphaproteobacteria bacterium 17-39-52]HQS83546.1 hypothetical protein [Alphaproteobacteria bacterium]HQS93305.1 hypothetical protein [Alphaproteobacteria bacterium]